MHFPHLRSTFAALLAAFALPIFAASTPTNGVLLLTFDDPHATSWANAIPLFAKYNAHASFFPNGELDAAALQSLAQLKTAGHTVGIHTLHHRDAKNIDGATYLKEEVQPQLDAYAQINHTVRAMAYPNNIHTPEMDAFLLAHTAIRHFRAGHVVKYDPQAKYEKPDLVATDEVFFPVENLPRRRVLQGIGIGEAYRTDIKEILACIRRAAKRNEVLVTFSHNIAPNAPSIHMKTEWLEKILATAHEEGLQILGFDDLPDPTALKDLDIRDFGASTLFSADKNRAAIQKAVDAASLIHGRVIIPRGTFQTGSIEMKSHVELHLEKGAILLGSTAQTDYNANDAFPENFHSVAEEWSGGHLIYANEVEDIAITGEGTIDGNGPAFFGEPDFSNLGTWYKYGAKLHPLNRTWFRPGPMLAFFLSKNIRLQGVTLKNTPCWTVHIRCSDTVNITNVTIDADRTIANADGFSIDCTRNVTITDSTAKTADDCFAIRASCANHAATNLCENITIKNCIAYGCCFGIRFGIGTGTIRNVLVENCRFEESGSGFGFTPAWISGTKNVYMTDITIRNSFVGQTDYPVTMSTSGNSLIKNVRFENCQFEAQSSSWISGNKPGRTENITFDHCSMKHLDHVAHHRDWKGEMAAAKDRRGNRGTFLYSGGDALFNLVVTNCTPRDLSETGALALSFEGTSAADYNAWTNLLPILKTTHAHATFFYSGDVTKAEITLMKRLVDAGHTIALGARDRADTWTRGENIRVAWVPYLNEKDPGPAPTSAADFHKLIDEAATTKKIIPATLPATLFNEAESILKYANSKGVLIGGWNNLPW